MKLKVILLTTFLGNTLWAAGGDNVVKSGCETLKIKGNLAFPTMFGGSDIVVAKKNCDGKTNLYLIQADQFAKCNYIKLSKNEAEVEYLDYAYSFKPLPKEWKQGENIDYCVSNDSKIERFKKTDITNELKEKVLSIISKPPYGYKLSKATSGNNFKKQWTHFDSEKGTNVVFVAVVNKDYKWKDPDFYLEEKNGEIFYPNLILGVLFKEKKVLYVKIVPSVGEVLADADGDGYPEVLYEYECGENNCRVLTDIKP